MNRGGYHGGPKPTGNPPKPANFVHNHGTEDGPGLACRERIVNGKLKGDCMTTELTPDKLREAADVMEEYNIRCKGVEPDLIARTPSTLRRVADKLEAEKAEKVERDRAIEELDLIVSYNCFSDDHLRIARSIYNAGWRKRSE